MVPDLGRYPTTRILNPGNAATLELTFLPESDMSRQFLCSVTLLAFVGCMPVSVTPVTVQPASPVELIVAAPTAEAFERVKSAFVAEGLTIAEANPAGGTIKSGGVMGDVVSVGGLYPVTSQTEMFFRATLIPTDSGTRILLTTTGRAHTTSSRGTEVSPELPASSCGSNETCQKSWAKIKERLDRLASIIRTK